MVVITTINPGTCFSLFKQLFIGLMLVNPHCNPGRWELRFVLGTFTTERERRDMVSDLKEWMWGVRCNRYPTRASTFSLLCLYFTHKQGLSFAYSLPDQGLV